MRTIVPFLLLLAVGCDQGSSSAVSSTAAPGATAPAIRGRLVDAPPDAEVFLLRPSPARDLYALADTVLDLSSIDTSGRFTLATPTEPGPWVLVVSAPGRALLHREVTADDTEMLLALTPEATCSLVLIDEQGSPESLACALVLDAAGSPLPLPALDMVSLPDGTLSTRRLPAGDYEVLIESADGERHARLELHLAAAEQRIATVQLGTNPQLAQRFLLAVGGPAAATISSLKGE